ncbi:protein of unknown function [Candidatus Methylomirabilis oxygeniifera]|uniref:Uncharacterized protein n=1 Tax=Methylomirabilis oxygeniifera TaxID=671143 RepID=D5MLD5_METO1|nr:protein of unknown function [Candidatus Methylomirabilis oxyfera]
MEFPAISQACQRNFNKAYSGKGRHSGRPNPNRADQRKIPRVRPRLRTPLPSRFRTMEGVGTGDEGVVGSETKCPVRYLAYVALARRPVDRRVKSRPAFGRTSSSLTTRRTASRTDYCWIYADRALLISV